MSKLVAKIGVPALAVLVLAGCGGSSSSSSTATSTTSTTTSTSNSANAAVVALVPAAVKSKGTLTVAADATYAPNEFIAEDGHTVIGMDPDLMKALGEVMGLKVNVVNATFDTIIPGLAAGKYDVGASSFTDTKERQKTVDFVTYFTAGVSFYGKSSGAPNIKRVEELCGKTVSVEKGTTEEEEAKAQSEKCTKAGKKAVTVLVFPDQNGANLAITSGRAELGMADSPVAAYAVKQSNGTLKGIGSTYGSAPYGIALPKGDGMTVPIQAALKVLISNGTYMKILEKWGVQAGAITNPEINGAKS
jgi:polar amino acid transport system substrate-binding protein